MMTVGSLFSGIGGLDLGLERAGMEIRWQCEINPYCREVLQKHWPKVRLYDDIRELHGSEIEHVDVIAGGFPCQDISVAGNGIGIHGARSSLFFEAMRLVREVRPRYVLLENVAALVNRGLDEVLGEMARCGYDAEWQIVPAAAVGAPHIRERVFVVAYPDGHGREGSCLPVRSREPLQAVGDVGRDGPEDVPNSNGFGLETQRAEQQSARTPRVCKDVSNSARFGRYGGRVFEHGKEPLEDLRCREEQRGTWAPESCPVGVAYGIPHRVDRLRALGNSVVPQVAEYVGSLIVEAEGSP